VTGRPATLSVAVIEFFHQLRSAAVPVSMVEALDAVEALGHVDLADRAQFKAALGATLVKRAEDQPAFDALFDAFFAPRREGAKAARPEAGNGGGPGQAHEHPAQDDQTALLQALLEALRADDAEALRALAGLAVGEYAGLEVQRAATQRYHLYRVLRRLDLSALLQRAWRAEREDAEERTALDDRLAREELAHRLEEFRRMLAEEVRLRLADARGPEQAAETLTGRPIEDVDFLGASPTELREMRQAIRPLARKLAARIAHRRRLRHRGRLDVRRTVRRSLSAGGVPLEPAFRRPRVAKPALYLLCDVSGSVAEFAKFTMALLQSMRDEFSRTRLFVFVDGVDEVTEAFEQSATPLDARHMLHRAQVVWSDGHSDYGTVFERFWDRWGGAALDPRTTLIVTGDARNNYRQPGVETLRLIRGHVRKLYWLNPEPRADWNTTDSIMDLYEPCTDGVYEARNLNQLAEFVYALA
jgi:uncharacterized protein with von Willebrand factor type A (vWA) domain